MKITKTTFLLGCAVGGMAAAVAPLLLTDSRADTRIIPFQGRLTDAAGAPIPDGAKVVEFKMYDAPTGGAVKWAGEVHKLSVNGGLVNTMLGSKATLGAVDFSLPTYLQITIDANNDGQISAADPPLLPRQSVIPSIFANEAQNSRQLAGHNWSAILQGGSNDPSAATLAENKLPLGISVPLGGVIMWWGSKASIPPGFELCDGAAPASGSALRGNKPDLRDKFVKGALDVKVDVSTNPVTGGQHSANLAHSHGIQHTHSIEHTHGGGGLYAQISGPKGWSASNESIFGRFIPTAAWQATRNIFVESTPKLDENTSSASLTLGVQVAGSTDGSSPQNSGPSSTETSGPALGNVDNRPAFLEMFFIIRVK